MLFSAVVITQGKKEGAMAGPSMGGIVFLAVLVVMIVWVVGIYNRLVGLRNRFKNSFAQIDVQLKRRYDLIPNLVAVARVHQHERKGGLLPPAIRPLARRSRLPPIRATLWPFRG
jgi:hypothetical protein